MKARNKLDSKGLYRTPCLNFEREHVEVLNTLFHSLSRNLSKLSPLCQHWILVPNR
jgi:hypothetical protein